MRFLPFESDRLPIRRQAGGYCVEGPGFYVWDEDPREVRQMLRDLGRGGPESPTPRATLPGDDSTGS